jgi:hypothetical protein
MHAGVIDDGAMDGACAVCGTSGAAWYNSCSSCCMNTAASFSVFSWVFLAVLRRTANTFWTCVITPLLPGPPRPIFSICGVVLGRALHSAAGWDNGETQQCERQYTDCA